MENEEQEKVKLTESQIFWKKFKALICYAILATGSMYMGWTVVSCIFGFFAFMIAYPIMFPHPTPGGEQNKG